MATLPKFAVLRSKISNKYLQFVKEGGDLHGFLQFSGDGAVSPYTKFQVEESESDQNLIHLKNCYNNKYWVVSAQNNNWVLADANDQVEDQSKLSSTLFEPTYVDGDKSAVRFMHVNTKKYVVTMSDPGQARDACLYLGSETLSDDSIFIVVDWSSLVILPRNVAFKGGPEGQYLSAAPANEGTTRYLQFIADNITDPTVGHEVFTSGDGNVSLKSNHYGKFWTRTTSSWILADTTDNDVTNKNILFAPKQVSATGTVIALLSSGNNDYCKSITNTDVTTGEPITALSASDAVITKLSQLEVVDLAAKRAISVDVSDVRLSDARIAAPKLAVMTSGDAVNASSAAKEMEVKLTFDAEALTRTWSSTSNGSLTYGVEVNVWSPLPVEDNGQVVMTSLIEGDFGWGIGEALSQTPTVKTYKVTVPAATVATVQAMGRRRLWDVPYSYTETNTLVDGTTVKFKMDDGIYTGTHTLFENYNVVYTPTN